MKKLLILLFSLAVASNATAQKSEHIIIITVDGFNPDFYLDPSWGMVNLRQMKENGVYAEAVNSQFPTVTFVNHTTIVTGEAPVNHGVLYNAPFKPKGQSSEWYWYAKDIKAPTLWGVAKENGMVTAAVNWPVSVDGPIDYNIPIFKKKGRDQLEVIAEGSNPPGFFEEVQQQATGKLSPEDFIVQKDLLAMDANVGRISAYILREYKPAVLTLRLSSVDHFQHRDGKDSKMLRAAVAGVDRSIRDIMEALERAGIADKSTVFVTGDHGFVNTHTSLSPNIWLKEAGVFKNNNDWKAQFHTVGGSAFLMLEDAEDDETAQKVRAILENRPPRERKLFEFVEREELDALGVDTAPAFGIKAIPGVVFKRTTVGEVIKPHRKGTHGYHPETPGIQTGFVGWGAGLNKGIKIETMDLQDIAPLAAELLGLEWDSEYGFLLKGLLEQ